MTSHGCQWRPTLTVSQPESCESRFDSGRTEWKSSHLTGHRVPLATNHRACGAYVVLCNGIGLRLHVGNYTRHGGKFANSVPQRGKMRVVCGRDHAVQKSRGKSPPPCTAPRYSKESHFNSANLMIIQPNSKVRPQYCFLRPRTVHGD